MLLENKARKLADFLNIKGFDGDSHYAQVLMHLVVGDKAFDLEEVRERPGESIHATLFIRTDSRRGGKFLESYSVRLHKHVPAMNGVVNGVDTAWLDHELSAVQWQQNSQVDFQQFFAGDKRSVSHAVRLLSQLRQLEIGPEPEGRQLYDQLVYKHLVRTGFGWYINTGRITRQFERELHFVALEGLPTLDEAILLVEGAFNKRVRSLPSPQAGTRVHEKRRPGHM